MFAFVRKVDGIGPMLKHDIWTRICDQRPRDMLCEPCIRKRFEQVYHRQLRIDDLLPCLLNVRDYQKLAPPGRLLADWARYIVGNERRFVGNAPPVRRGPTLGSQHARFL